MSGESAGDPGHRIIAVIEALVENTTEGETAIRRVATIVERTATLVAGMTVTGVEGNAAAAIVGEEITTIVDRGRKGNGHLGAIENCSMTGPDGMEEITEIVIVTVIIAIIIANKANEEIATASGENGKGVLAQLVRRARGSRRLI